MTDNKITADDYECAADLAAMAERICFGGNDVAALRNKFTASDDILAFVRAVAGHRIQARNNALEEAAKVAEGMLVLDCDGYDLSGFIGPNGYLRAAANAIRSLATTNTTGEAR